MKQKGYIYLLCLSFTISSKELFLYISSGLVIASSPNSLLQVISIFITHVSNYPLMMQFVFVRCHRSLPNTSLLRFTKSMADSSRNKTVSYNINDRLTKVALIIHITKSIAKTNNRYSFHAL
jgi:hypothetical protein